MRIFLVLLLTLIGCERRPRGVNQPQFDKSGSFTVTHRVKCWSGGEVIFDQGVYRAYLDPKSGGMGFYTVDGFVQTTADCMAFTIP